MESRMQFANATKLRRESGVWGTRNLRAGKGAQQVPRLPPDFLSGLVVSVNLMRLSSKKAAYVVVDESSVVGNPDFAPNDKKGGSKAVVSHSSQNRA
jgi:hypothetical protein